MYSKQLSFVLLLSVFGISLSAQVFLLADGPITNTLSDSRSVNFLDINNDGWEDIYISNGLQGGQTDLFYLNDGTGQFTEVQGMDIVEASNPSDGASFADYTNDGQVDAIVSSWYGAEDLLYLNNGNGQLDYNEDAGIAAGSYAETATFGDFDKDGWLDIYITNSGGSKKNFLYRNLQNGTFEQLDAHPFVQDAKLSRGATWTDMNNDGFLDLFVVNEGNSTNDLFVSDGNGAYQKWINGVFALSQRSSMTASWGDIDNNGTQDVFIGNSGFFTPQRNQLYLNTINGFTAISEDPVVLANNCTFGSAFGDYDNDGDLDLLISNGFCSSDQSNKLYENENGQFTDVSDVLPSNTDICSFGVAWGDVDNNGFLDVVIANCKNSSTDSQKANTLLLNQGNTNNWLQLKLIGTQSNTNAIGAKVRIKAIINGEEVWQYREVSAQTGYAGQNSMIVHFGLGDATSIDSLVIQWPSGILQVLEQQSANQKLEILEALVNSTKEIDTQIGFKVHPNPASQNDDVYLTIEENIGVMEGQLFIYDTLGRLCWREEIELNSDQRVFIISNAKPDLRAGMYQILLQVPGKRFFQNWIISD